MLALTFLVVANPEDPRVALAKFIDVQSIVGHFPGGGVRIGWAEENDELMTDEVGGIDDALAGPFQLDVGNSVTGVHLDQWTAPAMTLAFPYLVCRGAAHP